MNHSDLEQAFDVSTAQAYVDHRRHRELAGDSIEYDATGKATMVPRAAYTRRRLELRIPIEAGRGSGLFRTFAAPMQKRHMPALPGSIKVPC